MEFEKLKKQGAKVGLNINKGFTFSFVFHNNWKGITVLTNDSGEGATWGFTLGFFTFLFLSIDIDYYLSNVTRTVFMLTEELQRRKNNSAAGEVTLQDVYDKWLQDPKEATRMVNEGLGFKNDQDTMEGPA